MGNRQASGGDAVASSVVVVIPTYNERDNVEQIVQRVLGSVPAAEVLVVDDNSPDGTGEIADRMATADERVHVRTGLAVGAATAGFTWALTGVRVVGMTRWFPRPETAAVEHVGPDGPCRRGWRDARDGVNWPWYRAMLSRGANIYSKLALGVPVNDMTAGYRVYRREVLQSVKLHSVASQGYCFQVDLTWRSIEAGFAVAEVPITFVEREQGKSKMTGEIVREALVRVTKWGLRRRGNQLLSSVRALLR